MTERTPRARRAQAAVILPVGIVFTYLLPLLLFPIAAVFVFAASGGARAFWEALTSAEALFALRLSLLIALGTSVINAALGTFTAYVLSRYRFRGQGALSVIVTLPVAIPTVVVGTSLLLLWGPIGLLGRLLDPLGFRPMFSPLGILIAHLFVNFPYMIGAVKPVLDQLERTYEEAAYTMGASPWRTFLHVLLPALRGGLFAGSLLTFAHSLGEFGATVMVSGNLALRTQTAPLYVFAKFEEGNVPAANAVAAVLTIISFVLFFALLQFTRRPEREVA